MKSLGLKKTFGDVLLTFARQFLGGLFQLGIILIISRQLGPEGVGSFALALLFPTLMAGLLNLGIGSSNVYFIASGQVSEKEAWTVSRNIAIFMGFLGCGIGAIIIQFFNARIFPEINPQYLWIALGVLPISLMSGMITSLFQGLQNFRAFNIMVLTQPLLGFSAVVFLWVFDIFSLKTVLACVVASHLLGLIIGLILLGRRIPLAANTGNTPYFRRAISYGYKAHLGNILTLLIYRTDIFLVNLFVGPAAAGLYTVAVRLVEQLWIIPQAFVTVVLPRLASLSKDEDTRNEITPLVSRLVFWTTVLFAIMLAILAVPLTAWLFGHEFVAAVPALNILLPGVVVFASARVLAGDIGARGLIHYNLFIALAALLLNIAGNLILIPKFGITGAAISTSLSYLVVFILHIVVQIRLNKAPWWHYVLLRRVDFARLAAFRSSFRR